HEHGALPLMAALSAEVTRAAELDAEGHHADALVQLVAGVHKQDHEALLRLGKRLLIGDRAPFRPGEAAGFLADAVRLGSAEAAAIQATLRVMQAANPDALHHALNDLALAAERGFVAAQRQLAVIAGREDSEWCAIAQSFDCRAWFTPPASQELHADPRIHRVQGFIPAPFCRWLIERARSRLTRAEVYDGVTRETTTHGTRTNSAALFNLLDTDCVLALVQLRIARSLDVSFRHLEPAAVLHYAPGEEIKPHFDFVDPQVPNYATEIAQRGQRVVTFLVYLNDDYGDGHTDFPRLGLSHRGTGGDALYFVNALPDGKADVRTLHAGRPPRAGEKWIVSQFVRDRAVL
ncbi:MAG: 2OG-Fe(II) oxygenase, partial [Pseudomonadota bacterium]|nr:2OG-Fe(II) oxygenase [Pseudomonadota bacterium]